eukprot:Gb_31484 [translate_table: standard]
MNSPQEEDYGTRGDRRIVELLGHLVDAKKRLLELESDSGNPPHNSPSPSTSFKNDVGKPKIDKPVSSISTCSPKRWILPLVNSRWPVMASMTKSVSGVTTKSSQAKETCMNTSIDISNSGEDNSFVRELLNDTRTDGPPCQVLHACYTKVLPLAKVEKPKLVVWSESVVELLNLDPREFDDDVPSNCASRDYFKGFGPIFARNGRWSVLQPILILGNDDTYEEEDEESANEYSDDEDVSWKGAGDPQISSPLWMLKQKVPTLMKPLNRQLHEISIKTKVGAFSILKELVVVLPNCLSEHIGLLVHGIAKALDDTSSNSNLKIEALIFTRLVMASHSPFFHPYIKALFGRVLSTTNNRYDKVFAEALRVCGELVRAICPKFETPPGEIQTCLPILVGRIGNEITWLIVVKAFVAIVGSHLKIDLSCRNASDVDEELREYSLHALESCVLRYPWEMGVHKRRGTIYLDVHKLLERPQTEMDRQRTYWGYSFEKDGKKYYIELKTSRELDSSIVECFEREKLLKFWIQSFLVGVLHIVIGFRDDGGKLLRAQDLGTNDITQKVKTKNYWHGGMCLAFVDEVLAWALFHYVSNLTKMLTHWILLGGGNGVL